MLNVWEAESEYWLQLTGYKGINPEPLVLVFTKTFGLIGKKTVRRDQLVNQVTDPGILDQILSNTELV